jgi:hypothetical protein
MEYNNYFIELLYRIIILYNLMDELKQRIIATNDAIIERKWEYYISKKPNQYQLFELLSLRRDLQNLNRMWRNLF